MQQKIMSWCNANQVKYAGPSAWPCKQEEATWTPKASVNSSSPVRRRMRKLVKMLKLLRQPTFRPHYYSTSYVREP